MVKTCLLYSGGVDSLIAWHMLDKPDTIYVDLGHRYVWKELEAMSSLPPKPKVFWSAYGAAFEKDDAHIPGRNLYLAMYAAAEGYEEIHLVAQQGEQNIPDRSLVFFDRTSEMLSFIFGYKINLMNLAICMYKHEMVKWYLDKGLPASNLLLALSCYSEATSRYNHCGQCPACLRKYVVLTYNGVECEHIFEGDVKEWGRENYLPRLDEYDEERAKVMKDVLESET